MAADEKLGAANWKGIVEAALEIGRSRSAILQRMRAAFERGDEKEALKLGKVLCGLEK
jgi:hypothetical protein